MIRPQMRKPKGRGGGKEHGGAGLQGYVFKCLGLNVCVLTASLSVDERGCKVLE